MKAIEIKSAALTIMSNFVDAIDEAGKATAELWNANLGAEDELGDIAVPLVAGLLEGVNKWKTPTGKVDYKSVGTICHAGGLGWNTYAAAMRAVLLETVPHAKDNSPEGKKIRKGLNGRYSKHRKEVWGENSDGTPIDAGADEDAPEKSDAEKAASILKNMLRECRKLEGLVRTGSKAHNVAVATRTALEAFVK